MCVRFLWTDRPLRQELNGTELTFYLTYGRLNQVVGDDK